MTEAQIQRDIVTVLRSAGWHVSAIHNNPKTRSVYGYTPGFADLVAIRNGAVRFLEVKAGTNGQSQDQRDFQAAMERHKMAYAVVRSPKEALEAVQ